MDIKLYHDSHKSIYRSQFGAVPTGARLTLRLLAIGITDEEVYLRLWPVNKGDKLLLMTRVPGTDLFETRFTVSDISGLLWYFFMVKGKENPVYYGNNIAQRGGEGLQYDHEPPSYQITVYAEDSVTPEWFKHAIVYQIFPDRFYHSEKGRGTLKGKKNAVLHSCWNDKPYYCKNPQGGIVQYDFFGGNLAGIQEKLPYLQDLGINTIYLNPIFASASNHRYDTGDYKHIDPFLGTNEDFAGLCKKAKEFGIRIILDGVFSHTGDDSLYFNKYGTYPTVGAYQSKESPYYAWYKFNKYPEDYASWWGVGTLPEVTETTPSYMNYIFKSSDSVMKQWLNLGVNGWRLDVADELPTKFLESFWQELKKENKDNVLIGEVWEDASNKVSYSEQRAYFSGGKLDSVMNYVMRSIMLDFMLGKANGTATMERILQQEENYPQENFYACLNLVGSHDVERVLTILQGGEYNNTQKRPELADPLWMKAADSTVKFQEDENNFKTGRLLAAKNKIAAGKNRSSVGQDRLCSLITWQMTMPGAPCVYYGDEAGLEGYKDPDNRRTFPWGQENYIIQSWYRQMIHIRRDNDALSTGRFVPLYGNGNEFVYARCIEGNKDVFGKSAKDGMFVVALNSSTTASKNITVDTEGLCVGTFKDLIHKGPNINAPEGRLTFSLPPLGVMLLERIKPTGKKRAGVLLHPTSLPMEPGENITEAAYKFLDFLHASGQSLWQILPLNPPGVGNSPYQSVSAFAGDTGVTMGMNTFVTKNPSLKQEFWEKNKYWLDDYALYVALKEYFQGKPWYEWPEDIKKRQKSSIAKYRDILRAKIEKIDDEQFIFFTEWGKIRNYAHKFGIHIMGDVPIFVSHDSADCWAHQEYFLLNEDGMPELVSGVPPDYFSEEGQLWGNPLYNWRVMAQDNYEWWQERFAVAASLVDEVRIDHFRGFAACWGVKYGAKTAKEGKWYKGPGESLFEFVQRALPELTLIAEDLGVITEDVSKMKNDLGFSGMRLLHFGIKEREGGSVAFDTESNCYAYTGTHDNNTTVGWYTENLSDQQQQEVCKMLGLKEKESAEDIDRKLVEYVYSRQARTVIIPMQDILALPSDCRMNTPGTATGNWQGQLTKKQLSEAPIEWLKNLCVKYKR